VRREMARGSSAPTRRYASPGELLRPEKRSWDAGFCARTPDRHRARRSEPKPAPANITSLICGVPVALPGPAWSGLGVRARVQPGGRSSVLFPIPVAIPGAPRPSAAGAHSRSLMICDLMPPQPWPDSPRSQGTRTGRCTSARMNPDQAYAA
jgi:hypothetical protein